MRIGSLGVGQQIPAILRMEGHEVVQFRRVPTRGDAKTLDLLVVCGYPSRIGVDVFAAPRLGTWNVHPSLLPAGRGPQPVRWALLRGDERFGVSIHQMTDVIDGGPLWWQAPLNADVAHTFVGVSRALFAMAAREMPAVIARCIGGASPTVTRGGEYEPRVPPALLRLDPELDAERLARRVAANDDRAPRLVGPRGPVRVRSGRVIESPTKAAPGTVLRADPRSFVMATGRGALALAVIGEPHVRPGDVLRAEGLP